MTTRAVTIPTRRNLALSAKLDLPADDAPLGYALFAHCFTCSKDLKAAVNISRSLTSRRIAVLRFDFTGLGQSEGAFDETTFATNLEDLADAAGWLTEHHRAPSLLIGHSLGGAAVLQVAHQLPETRAVVTIGAPADPTHVEHLLAGSLDELESTGFSEVQIGGRPFRLRREFLQALRDHPATERIRDLRKPLMILHSPIDQTVGIENAAEIYSAARHPKSFISLDQADHLLSNKEDSTYAATVLAAWASRDRKSVV